MNLKKLLAFTTSLMLLIPITTNNIQSNAETIISGYPMINSGTLENGVQYDILEYDDSTVAYITGYDENITTDTIEIPSQIDVYPVTKIGWSAFEDATFLKSVTLPNTLIIINSFAFSGCTNLESIDIPESVTTINYDAFSNCTSLKSINLPKNISNIASDAFNNTPFLESFTDEFVILGDGILYRYQGTNTEVIIPNDVKYINNGIFRDNSSITNVYIPNTVKEIKHSAFNNCTALEYINIPDSVTEIGYGVFYNCKSLKSLTIPSSVTNFGGGIYNCTLLETLTFEDGTSIIDGDVICENCPNLTTVNIPNSVTRINNYFYDCTALKSVTIPSSVTYIHDHAFGYINVKGSFQKMEDFTVYGYKGSTAETFALKNGFNFVILDDNIQPNYIDILTLKKYLLGFFESSPSYADYNQDGTIDILDLNILKNKIAYE